MSSDRRARPLWPLLVPLALLAVLIVVAYRARHQLQREPEFTVDPTRYQLVARPAWLTEDVAGSVAASVSSHAARGASLLRQDELAGLTASLLAASPWIEAVEQIQPRWPAQADVRVRLRRPVMAIDGDILVAADGRVLGLGPVVLDPPPLQCAKPARDADVLQCAAAAAEVLPFRAALQDVGVVLASVTPDAEGTVSFITDQNVVLAWGRSADSSPLAYLDLPPSQRIDNLREVLADFPGLVGLQRVQLWTDRPVVVRRDE
ncbi:MAG TPA: hypothetical protein VFY71_11245 [Planctomycetota bacterium]|nr:hypothetical protein [Planctomycetota bacterium]